MFCCKRSAKDLRVSMFSCSLGRKAHNWDPVVHGPWPLGIKIYHKHPQTVNHVFPCFSSNQHVKLTFLPSKSIKNSLCWMLWCFLKCTPGQSWPHGSTPSPNSSLMFSSIWAMASFQSSSDQASDPRCNNCGKLWASRKSPETCC